jgi:hypothetical protein
MKRLRDVEAPSPLVEKAQALIDAVDPVDVSDARMLRIRRELDAPRGALATARRVPALALALFTVLFGASAFAAVRIYVAVTQPPAAREPSTAAPERAPRTHRAAQPKQAAEPARDPALDEAPPEVEPPAPAPRTEPRVHGKLAPKTRSVDSELVHRAVQALRVDHDPALAARLLDENRARYPNGPLAEEALSLQIEAALDLGAPRAQTLAAEYVARYPNGRYLAAARRALAGAAP